MAWKPSYISRATAKLAARITTTVDDALVDRLVAAASRLADDYTHRQFGKAASSTTRYYTARWSRTRARWIVVTDDIYSATGLTVTIDGTAVESGDGGYTLEPRNAVADGEPYEGFSIDPAGAVQPCGDEYEVAVTTISWGWSAVPAVVEQAVTLQMSRLNWRRDAPHGVSGSPQTGGEVRMLERLDPDAVRLLKSVTRTSWAA